MSVETSKPRGASIVTGPVSEVPLIVKLRAPDGEPVPAVKLPILGTEVQIRGGTIILRVSCLIVLLPTRFLATKLMVKFPPTVGVPEITPVVELMLSPLFGGRVALYERIGGFVAVIWYENGTFNVPAAVALLVITGTLLGLTIPETATVCVVSPFEETLTFPEI